MGPFFSILIPTYNQCAYLPQAIEGALSQSHPSFEVVVLDDGSTDKTQAVCRPYLRNKKFRYVRNPENLGRVANYRNGLYEEAAGTWVIICDGDDFLCDENMLSDFAAVIHSDPDLVFVQGGFCTGPDLEEATVMQPNLPNAVTILEGKSFLTDYLSIKHFSHLTLAFHRQSAMQLNFYSKDILSADLYSFFQLALTGKVAFIKGVYGLWRIHGQNASLTKDLNIWLKNIEVILKLKDYLRRHIDAGPELKKSIHTLEAIAAGYLKNKLADAIYRRKTHDIRRIWDFTQHHLPALLTSSSFLIATLKSVGAQIKSDFPKSVHPISR